MLRDRREKMEKGSAVELSMEPNIVMECCDCNIEALRNDHITDTTRALSISKM